MLRGIGVSALAFGALALAQNAASPGMNPNGQQNGNSSGNANSNSTSGGLGRMTRAASGALPGGGMRDSSPMSAVSGRVVLSGGDESEAGILVQRVCGATVMGETRTDSAGHFYLARASAHDPNLDASNSNGPVMWGCELRASFAGYQPGSLPLGDGRASDGEVLIILPPAGAASAMTISATTLLAPKNAQKAFGKGLDALHRNQPDLAHKEFGEAARIYPRFAAAWFELGKVYEQRGHHSDARNAYAKSIAADGEFLFPYMQLCRMDVREGRWKEAVDASSKVLRLDPYEFPEAYYINAFSNLALNDLDAAERSARESTKLEGAQAEPRGNFVLGVVLWRKGDLQGAEEKLQTFLAASSGGTEPIQARRILADIQRERSVQQASQAASRHDAETPRQVSSPPDAGPGR